MESQSTPSISVACQFWCLCLLLLSCSRVGAAPQRELPAYEREQFSVDGRSCFVDKPHEPARGRPWVWRARFPGYHAEVDQILLQRGFHIAYTDTSEMFGSEAALDHWDHFYAHMTGRQHRLASKVALEGVSRGGLFVYRWAARNPNQVACIYADTPVCDFKSWPLGRGSGVGHSASWQILLKRYHLTEAEASSSPTTRSVPTIGSLSVARWTIAV